MLRRSQTHQKMPCGHGRTSSNTEKVVSRGLPLSKRYLDQKNYKFHSKERQGPAPLLRNSEQRCIILTLVTVELNALKFLVPFPPPVQGCDSRNHLDSEAHVNGDGLELSPLLSIFFQFDLPKEQKIDSSECTDSAKSCSSYGENVLGKSHNSSKRNKSVKSSSSTSQPSPTVSNNFSGSDVLVCNIPKVDKPVKRISRKKGKKKGKQYKRSTHNKVFPVSETQRKEGIDDVSVTESHVSSDTASTSEYTSQNNISVKTVKGIRAEQDESTVKDDDRTNSLASSLTPTSCSSEIDELICNQLGMDEASDILPIRLSSIRSPETTRFTSDENATDTLPIQKGIPHDISSAVPLDQDYPQMADILLDSWKKNISEKCSNDDETRTSIVDDDGLNCSNCRSGEIPINCHSSNHYWSKDIVDTDNSTERAQCISEASNSNDFEPVIHRKKGRLTKKASQSLNGIHRFGTTNMHDLATKDNRSIWQRVQKKETKERIREPKKVNLVSQHIEISAKGFEAKTRSDSVLRLEQNGNGNLHAKMADQIAQIDIIKASSDDVDSSELLSKAIDGRCNVADMLKRKSSSASKQGNNYVMKGSHPDKTNMDRPSKIHVQQKELETSIGLSPYGSNDFQSVVVMPVDKIHCQSGAHHQTQINVNENAVVENIGSMVCHLLSQDTENLVSPVAVASNSSDSEGSHADSTKLVSSSISVLQKWIPVGKKDPVVFITRQTGNMTASAVNELVPDSLDSKNEVELLSSNSLHSLQTNEVSCLSPSSEDTGCPFTEADELTKCHPRAYGEFGGVLAVSNRRLAHEVNDQPLSGFESDLIKIVEAVDDSYKLQTASQGVHLMTGSPVAEFERFLHSASPLLDQMYCSTDQLIGDSLCRHQIPNISLGSLWLWYEKHGSYGMEVKVEDHYDSKGSRNGPFEFRAYFVPYLSAVQLFGWSGNSVSDNNGDPLEVTMEACEVGKTSKFSSYSAPSPISSLPLSQPHNEVDACKSKFSSPTIYDACNKSVRSTELGNEELLFEYFESDQPQQRRPFFEKMKELLRGDSTSSCQIFGNPSKLESLNLHDLHPASWYSVAWYPIYRIPEGNFRAAFLTYHSLGHFVRSASNAPRGVASIGSPVVGLQSYNAKGECWFKARGLKSMVVQAEEAMSDHLEILKERLRTLERTASVMARASVRKGNVRSVNRQPDYEFFVSRRQ